ncbi:uncharacterized protein LOC121810772 [Salvia splendens]|uniref:uncharacterized protein LOC121810772 n=1 Tax=Salvia splendens TaxID=180675 RepID=UPI001C2560D1|nr:uncharacterized protein LOC121810772 [Salvia splendens]
MRFGYKGKLSPRYIGPYDIVERVGPLAYRLALLPELEQIHNVFHVSMLRRYQSDPSHVMKGLDIQISENLSYIEEPDNIVDRQVNYWEVSFSRQSVTYLEFTRSMASSTVCQRRFAH